MAEAVFLIIVVGFILVLSTSYLVHLFKFYALRSLLVLFRLEKEYRNVSPKYTKASHMALDIMNKPKTFKEAEKWISSEK